MRLPNGQDTFALSCPRVHVGAIFQQDSCGDLPAQTDCNMKRRLALAVAPVEIRAAVSEVVEELGEGFVVFAVAQMGHEGH